ncbi:sensor histidine kinase [Alteribacillus sp. HJP-4]|uniref:sensor histidine kinase n=1 Tax=Alteribacillus sp. HJP-4 TaxID=2775394 RepID=UPI0035CCCF85
MNNKWEKWNSESAAVLCRVLGLVLLSLLWMLRGGGEEGIILLLFLVVATLARWRLPLPGWTVFIDQLACIIAFFYWPFAAFALAVPIFESMYLRQPWLSIPALLFVIVYSDSSIFLLAVFVQAGLSGIILAGWKQDTKKFQKEADHQRRDRYELENLKEELLLANAQSAQMAELAERNRIAQQLHDEVGHELTASVLALQAYEQLEKDGDSAAEEMFEKARERLTNSAAYLRETVHNMKSVKELGIEGFQEISDQFTMCPIHLQIFGDTTKIQPHLWSILYPCLKEALTNIARHATPQKVEVTLDINPHILRLAVHNDGADRNRTAKEAGVGLRNLRHRARAVGGSISTDTTDGFLLICVLPLETRRHE